MTISFIDIKSSLNKAFRLLKPKRNDLNIFKSNLNTLLGHINEQETEEHVKIHLMDFLKNTYFHPQHLVATNGRTDFVIHTGNNAQTPVAVMFEVKKPSNKAEMITKTNLNARAMHELILYFLRERIDKKNLSLTSLIITNIYEWYVFDAVAFEKIFTQNKDLQSAYREWKNGQKISTSTGLFYNEIVKPFLKELDKEISFTFFDLRDFQKSLKSNEQKNDTKLIALYKFFTPINLLKLSFTNDSNSLDKGFFAELLHIIGLEEVKDGSRKVIDRPQPAKRNPGSIIENALSILEVEDCLRKVPSKLQIGESREQKLLNLAIDLSITWINRLLFLKLLEAQLQKYHQEDQKYRFLNIQTIKDYDELYKLFFQVLAKKSVDRLPAVREKYRFVPYLNSSLFEISELEDITIKINALDDNVDIPIYSNSVLRKGKSKIEGSTLNTLNYLFAFLDSYDFSSVGKEEIQEDNKTIINASVLGLVFEKINGYKDGSIYTPGAITMYLCKDVIRRSVVKKFNDNYGWNCGTIADLRNHIADKRNSCDVLEFNIVIDTLRLADPAVGSGHFLVSSLNELIAIKAELGIFADRYGNRISDVDITIANDELVVNYMQGQDFFDYQVLTDSEGKFKVSPQIQRIQEALFDEKRKLIENCLFGVDINPNSVKICQLRLWIELLKNAYYKVGDAATANELETLPNIDINIKQGNSLLNKYSLKEDLSDVFKKNKFGVKDYQLAVQRYKEAPNKEAKEDLRNFIKEIKAKFHETVSNRDPRRKRLSEWRGKKILAESTNNSLFGQTKSLKDIGKEVAKYQKEIDKISLEIAEIENNTHYKNAFEWRFEFPEVLDKNGDFIGFDVIIGNPPYIQLQKMGSEADILQRQNYDTYVRTGDIYSLFYEQAINLLKPDYYFGYITSNKWMRANYGESTRKYFLKSTNPLSLIDFSGYPVFDSATVDVNILVAQKSPYLNDTQTCLIQKSLTSLEKLSDFIEQNTSKNVFKSGGSWALLSSIEKSIKEKIERLGVPLKDWDIQINYGIKTGFNEAFIINEDKKNELVAADPKSAEIIRPILRGRDIKKYDLKFGNQWIINTHNGKKDKGIKAIEVQQEYPIVFDHLKTYEKELNKRLDKGKHWSNLRNCAYLESFNEEKIVWIELTDRPNFALDLKGYFLNNTIFFMTGNHLKYLLGFLNSRLCEWYFDKIAATSGAGTRRWIKMYIDQICVPKPNDVIESKINLIIDSLNAKFDDSIYKDLNQLIYNIFELSPEEVQLINDAEL
ncbi:hypothetical protein ASU31_00875 [Pedobacter ginsenosidimutans]|uniref:site-specific DNA-methyltransferase (adenine-specific) n=1 Tax=Pedobacter ginsenosidimutans TaxID=687842 RepID=A0A0T5VVI7_9SPHI|nr:TaqI-like C-terminal specificity domain-containing protein [Pedobacter ginsenosidimutans]KRT17879.1 hypothetical protein ASU31_00875 [Pedobacter ginsenosidimutans]